MSKISRAVKRFELTKIGSDVSIEVKCLGLTGKETETFFDLLDRKDKKGALRYIVMTSLKKDDPTTTDSDYDAADIADILLVANATTRQSGMGEMFEFDREKRGLKSGVMENQSSDEELQLSKITSLRKRMAEEKEH